MEQMTSICDMVGQIMQKKEEERRIAEDQAAKDRYWKIPICYDEDEDYTIAITPVLSTKEPVDSLIMEDEHLDTIPATESDEVIKSSVEELVLIPSESEGISDGVCDEPLCDNPTPLKAFKDHSEIVVDSNDDDTSSDDVNFEDIEYVEASPPDLEIVSLEEVNDVDQEKEEFDLEDILQIQDGELTNVVMGEPRVHVPNVLPTHPTLMMDSDVIIRTFLPYFTYPMDSSFPPSSGNEDTIFNSAFPLFIFLLLSQIPQDHEDPCLFSILQSSGLRSFAYFGILNPDHIPSGGSKVFLTVAASSPCRVKIQDLMLNRQRFNTWMESSNYQSLPQSLMNKHFLIRTFVYGDKHLSTIPEKESDELIKSSVENLVLIPSESEVTSDNKSECDVPVDDESSPTFTTFSNPLFDSNDDFTSSDDESLSDEDVPKENFKIYSNPLFDDEEIISTKIDPHSFNAESNFIESLLNRDTLIDSSPKFDYLLEEFSGELAHIDPIPPGIKKADFDLEEEIRFVENLLYDNSSPRPPKERDSEIADTIIASPSPYPIPVTDSDSLMEEIDLFLASDDSMPPGIDSDYSDSEGDNLFLERLLHDDPTPLPDIPSPTHVTFPFEDHHDLDFTCVVRVFLPFFTYPVTSSLLLSSGSEDTIFDPSISIFHFSSLKPVAYENPIVIFLFFCFCPKDKGIRGESS
ncbi:hypothetical protein Tco_0877307 [Tanacetum coccineum]|uniref:Uncharacterized protein n=1 Tax=Tanacetum coccineum TaxID=301880 RepID=A0ABQ5BXF2_9ASTR